MPPKDMLTEGEMEAVTVVFKQYETGLREACITAKVRYLNKDISKILEEI